MKRFPILAAAGVCALAACSDSFLTEQPIDFVGPANFFNNATDAVAATNAAYASFVSLPSPLSNDGYYGRNFYMIVEYPTEVMTNRLSAGNERSLFDNYNPTMNAAHPYLQTVWQSAYSGINRANAVVSRVPAVPMDTTLRKRLVGEAKFLRALHYFNLVGLFGDVPVRLEETTSLEKLQSGRVRADSVYLQIIKDLTEAIPVLPERNGYSGADYGRVTRGAARAMLSKALLQAQATGAGPAANVTQAADLLRQVITSNQYALDPNYGSLFDGTNEQSREMIFSLQNIRVAGAGGTLSKWMAPLPRTGTGVFPGALTHFSVEWPFLQSYAPTDTRRAATWLLSFVQDGRTITFPSVLPTVTAERTALNDSYGGQTGGPVLRKFLDFGAADAAEGIDYAILRYADVQLMLAEAVGPTAEGYTAVNAVRSRAGVANLVAGLSPAAFRDSVFVQRRFEFAGEGHGVFDSRRNWTWAKQRAEANMALTGSTGAGINRTPFTSLVPKLNAAPINDKWKLYPIPQRAIDLNPTLWIKQNPAVMPTRRFVPLATHVAASTMVALLLGVPPFAGGALAAQTAPLRTVITRPSTLEALQRDAQRNAPALAKAREKLLKDAAKMATERMVTVTDKASSLPPTGDTHDYLSLSPYWWPDSSKKDGLPYIRHDGVTNPESKRDLDQPRLAAMADRVQLFTLAWWVSGDAKWATLAAQQLRTWFIDPATRMNPNLTYAQLIRGRDEERGTGIIDGRGFIEVTDMAGVLRRSPAWSAADDAALVAWFRDYHRWLTTSSHGEKEHAAKNNHGSWYAAHASAVALFVGDTARVRTLATETKARIGWQIKPDGSQPEELARTRSMHYTNFNAEALSRVAEAAQQVGIDLWHFTAPEGGSLAKTVGLLAQYAGRESTWPGQQIDAMSQQDLLRTLARARLALGDKAYDDAIGRLPPDLVARDRSVLLFWRGQ